MTSKNQQRSLTPQELEAVKEKLNERKKVLWQEILEDLVRDANEEHQGLIETIKDHGDAGLEELRESTIFSLLELKHNELEMIERSLARIEEGKYGHCVDCGGWIRPARLEIMPYAVRCRDCQAAWEKRA